MTHLHLHKVDFSNLPESAFELKVTIDHDEIERWAVERDGHPARVRGLVIKNSGHLCIDLGGNEWLERIPWEDFFEIFEDDGLAFVFQEYKKDGTQSRYFEFVSRSQAHHGHVSLKPKE